MISLFSSYPHSYFIVLKSEIHDNFSVNWFFAFDEDISHISYILRKSFAAEYMHFIFTTGTQLAHPLNQIDAQLRAASSKSAARVEEYTSHELFAAPPTPVLTSAAGSLLLLQNLLRDRVV